MSLADELQRIAEEAKRLRERLGELSLACAELRAQIAPGALGEPTGESTEAETPGGMTEDAPRKLQSVS